MIDSNQEIQQTTLTRSRTRNIVITKLTIELVLLKVALGLRMFASSKRNFLYKSKLIIMASLAKGNEGDM